MSQQLYTKSEQLRAVCIEQAVRAASTSGGSTLSPNEIVGLAKQFEDYISGDDRPSTAK